MDGLVDTFQIIVANVASMVIYEWLKEFFNKRTKKHSKKRK